MSDNFRHPSSPPPATNVPADQPGPAAAPTHIANGQMTTHDARHTETATNTGSSNSHSPSPHQPVPPAHRHLPADHRRATATAVRNKGCGSDPRPCRTGSTGPARPASAPASTGRPAPAPAAQPTIRSWPLVLLAAPAAVAVWSGWVGIGRMTGFGQVRPLPGIWDSLHLDSAITLPIGVEAYAAYALRAWLASGAPVTRPARRFARWSAIAALLLGMAGQIAYHLLTQAGATRAPWEITTAVSCLPVVVLGMGTALAHLLRAGPRSDTEPAATPGRFPDHPTHNQPAGREHDRSHIDQPAATPALAAQPGKTAHAGHRTGEASQKTDHHHNPAAGSADPWNGQLTPTQQARMTQARTAATQLTVSGQRISRRTLRAWGVKGSNADLGVLARIIAIEPAAPGTVTG